MITVSNIDNLAFIFFPPQIFWYKFRRWSFYHQAMLEKKQKARTLGSSLGGQNLITTPSCSNRNQFGVIDIITTRKSPKPSNKWVHQEGRIWWQCNDGGPREHASKKLNFLSFFFFNAPFLGNSLITKTYISWMVIVVVRPQCCNGDLGAERPEEVRVRWKEQQMGSEAAQCRQTMGGKRHL